MINYAIPGLYELADTNMNFLHFMRQNPQYFYNDVNVDVVYGNPQFCIWDGGRIFDNYTHATSEEIERLINIYNYDFNIKCRYVFTNSILEEKHFSDRFCNIMVDILDNGYGNHIVSANDKLTEYLQKQYKTIQFVSSTTKCITDLELCKAELDKKEYFMVCLDYNLNKKMNFLKELSIQQKEKVEFLINAICSPKCPKRKDHYYLNSYSHLNYGKPYRMDACYIYEDSFFPDEKIHGNNLTYLDIKEKYVPLGFSHFKIEGRTWGPLEAVLTYCNYMVKPEYKDYVLRRVLA